MKRGLTLPEVMLALALLAIALVSLVTLFGRGLQLQRKSTQLVQATQAAQRQLEAVRDMPFASLPTGSVSFDSRLGELASAGFPPPPYPNEALPLRVRLDPYMGGDLRWVRVEVFYAGGSLLVESLIAP